MPTCNGNGTVRAFIYPYANSSSENEKANYVMGVCADLGIPSTTRPDWKRYEGGSPITRPFNKRRILRWSYSLWLYVSTPRIRRKLSYWIYVILITAVGLIKLSIHLFAISKSCVSASSLVVNNRLVFNLV